MSEKSSQSNNNKEDSSITDAMTKFKDLISYLDGNTPKAPESFKVAFENTFDKSLVAVTKPLRFHESSDVHAMNYDELYNSVAQSFEDCGKAAVVDMKPYLENGIQYTVYMTHKNTPEAVVFRSIAFVNKDGKIVRLERQKTEGKPVPSTVSGQVAASADASLIEGLPEESLLARTVLSLPEQLHGQYLVDDPEIVPAKKSGQLIKLLLDHRHKGFLGRKGDVMIRDLEYHPYAGGAHFKEYHRPISLGVFVLQDKNDKPIAMCIQSRKKLNKTYYIRGTKPLLDGDEPRDEEAGVSFYRWLQVHVGSEDVKKRRHIEVWNGTDYEPMWRAKPAMKRANDYSDEMVFVPGQFVLTTENDHEPLGFLIKTSGGGQNVEWKLTMAPGVDPAVMLCIAVLLEV